MRSFFKKLFSKEKINLAELALAGATIVDVRSPGEYKHGHVKGSL
ncbi:MAG: rhodanese-like domain-containing protein, partial [Bacteroidia bacterium]